VDSTITALFGSGDGKARPDNVTEVSTAEEMRKAFSELTK